MTKNIENRLRKIVETSTKKAAIEEWREASENHYTPLYNYRFDHVEEVVNLAQYIASGTDANMDAVVLSAWLHDLAKPGVGGVSAQDHGILSAELAQDILSREGLDPVTINRITDVIQKHVGLTLEKPLEPIEAQILWEADKILKLGLIGMLHYILNGICISPGMSLPDISIKIKEFLPLAQKIVDSVVTDRGKEIAQERLRTLHELSITLESELNPRNNQK